MMIMITNLRVNRIPSIPKKLVFFGFARRPIAPSKVPAGQIYLQKPGTARSCLIPYHIGTATANTARITYLR